MFNPTVLSKDTNSNNFHPGAILLHIWLVMEAKWGRLI